MTNEEIKREQIREKLIQIFLEYTKLNEADLRSNANLHNGVDSLTLMEIVFQIEEGFSIEINDEEMTHFKNIGEITESILKKSL